MVDDGGSVFPHYWEWENERKGYTETNSEEGIKLRDYFAAKAMLPVTIFAGEIANGHGFIGRQAAQQIAVNAYALADAMLEARKNAR